MMRAKEIGAFYDSIIKLMQGEVKFEVELMLDVDMRREWIYACNYLLPISIDALCFK